MHNRNVIGISAASSVASLAATAALVVCVWSGAPLLGQQSAPAARSASPSTFSSPTEAARALAQAVTSRNEEAVETILGVGKDVTSSGDESLDALERDRFVRKFEEMHRFVRESDGTTFLYIGAENWPFPIPLTSKNGRWSFDGKAGADEIRYRTIGENETRVIEACLDLDATTVAPESQDGYQFRKVADATSGTKSAVGTTGRASKDSAISGIAFVVSPIDYRSSGVMTFVVTAENRVFERDLGPETSTRAAAIGNRIPAAGWKEIN